MESSLSLQDIINIALKHNIKDVLLTDINGLYGMLFFQSLCIENGLRPITGCHLKYRNTDLYAIVKNADGYRNLCNIISKVHQNKKNSLMEIIKGHVKGLIFMSGNISVLKALKRSGIHDFHGFIRPDKDWYQNYKCIKEMLGHVFLGADICCGTNNDAGILKMLKAIRNNGRFDEYPLNNTTCSFDRYLECFKRFENIDNPRDLLSKINFRYHQSMLFIKNECSEQKLRGMVYGNISKRYKDPGAIVYDRVNKEMDLIIKKGFCDYFLTVHDIIKNRRYYCGRGSAAASIVAYLLYITDIDPIRHDLYFERFLNEARDDPPDIDLDFPWDERDDVLEQIFKKYSCDNCALVSNIITFKERMAIREVSKVFGAGADNIFKKTSRINYSSSKKEIYGALPHNVKAYAERIIGFPRHIGVHCGGIIVTPPRIYDYVPVEMAKKGMPIIQWEKDQAEMGGLVKIDILGNRTLAVIRDTIDNLKAIKGAVYEYKEMNIVNDKRIKASFAKGASIGVFYLESPAIRQLQKKIGSGEFEDLTVHSSIIRPAANKYINEYIRRKKGGSYKPLHPALNEVLKDTYGIMVYQEDIEKSVINMLGFSLKDSFSLRKSLTSKSPEKKIYYKNMFYEKGALNNIKTGLLDKIWSMIESFAGYSFNKPHSASYVMVSYKSGYFKEYYPAFFYAAVIENRGGYYHTGTYINHAKRLGIKVLKPSVNNCLKKSHACDNNTIRLSLSFIKGISETTITNILHENKKGPFMNMKDFYRRMFNMIDHSQVVLLILSGVFDEFADHCDVLHLLMQYLCLKDREIYTEMPLHKLNEKKLYFLENKYYGFSLREHPVAFVRKRLKDQFPFSASIEKHKNKEISLLGFYVTAKLLRTVKNKNMAFLSFEDEQNIYDTVLFPEQYEKLFHFLYATNIFILKGFVKEDHGVFAVELSDITPLMLFN